MSGAQTIKTRILQKIATTAEWDSQPDFIPLKGEICIYSDKNFVSHEGKNYPGIKIGDGGTSITSLPFVDDYLYKVFTNKDETAGIADGLKWKMPLPSYYKDSFITEENGIEGYGFNAVSLLEVKQKGSGDPYPAGGSKNLIPYPYSITTSTMNGITYTANADGSITANGTPTDSTKWSNMKLHETGNQFTLKAGSYILTYEGAKDSQNLFIVLYQQNNDTAIATVRNKTKTEFTVSKDIENCFIRIGCNAGYAPANEVLKFMLVSASETDLTYEPYSNIRPIIGYDTISITRSGKNLMPNWEQGSISTGTGNNNDSPTNIRCIDYIPVIPNALYTLSRTGSSDAFGVRCYDKDKNYLGIGETGIKTISGGNDTNPMNATINEATIRIKEGCYYLRFVDYANDLTNQYQMEIGETATDYEPYKGETFTVSLGNTYYGGSVNWNTGELIVDMKRVVFTGNEDWGWNQVADGTYRKTIYNYTPNAIRPDDSYTVPVMICSHYPVKKGDHIWGSTTGIGMSSVSSGHDSIMIYDNRYNTAETEQWKAYLAKQYNAGTPIQIVYKLAEPQIIKLPGFYFYPTMFEGLNIFCSSPFTSLELITNTSISNSFYSTFSPSLSSGLEIGTLNLNGVEHKLYQKAVDDTLDENSSNPVQNKVIYDALAGKIGYNPDLTQIDSTVTSVYDITEYGSYFIDADKADGMFGWPTDTYSDSILHVLKGVQEYDIVRVIFTNNEIYFETSYGSGSSGWRKLPHHSLGEEYISISKDNNQPEEDNCILTAGSEGNCWKSIESLLPTTSVVVGDYGLGGIMSWYGNYLWFDVPKLSFDSKGRCTTAENKQVYLPALNSNSFYNENINNEMTISLHPASNTNLGGVKTRTATEVDFASNIFPSVIEEATDTIVTYIPSFAQKNDSEAGFYGRQGLVPRSESTEQDKFLRGDGSWAMPDRGIYYGTNAPSPSDTYEGLIWLQP